MCKIRGTNGNLRLKTQVVVERNSGIVFWRQIFILMIVISYEVSYKDQYTDNYDENSSECG